MVRKVKMVSERLSMRLDRGSMRVVVVVVVDLPDLDLQGGGSEV